MRPKVYRYVVTLSEPIWPRHLADIATMLPYFASTLLAVTDLQEDGHRQGFRDGPTYYVTDAGEEVLAATLPNNKPAYTDVSPLTQTGKRLLKAIPIKAPLSERTLAERLHMLGEYAHFQELLAELARAGYITCEGGQVQRKPERRQP